MAKNTILSLALTLLFISLLSGCSQKYDPQNPIEGFWVMDKGETINNEVIYSFHRASTFEQNKPGYAFKPDCLLISRQNAGWCGTPPISYVETQGGWSKDKNRITLNGIFWGGKFVTEFEINKLDGNQLEVKQISTKYN
jgi:hypothetical protein